MQELKESELEKVVEDYETMWHRKYWREKCRELLGRKVRTYEEEEESPSMRVRSNPSV